MNREGRRRGGGGGRKGRQAGSVKITEIPSTQDMAGCVDLEASTPFWQKFGARFYGVPWSCGLATVGREYISCFTEDIASIMSFETKMLGVGGGNETITASTGGSVSVSAEGQQQRASVGATGGVFLPLRSRFVLLTGQSSLDGSVLYWRTHRGWGRQVTGVP